MKRMASTNSLLVTEEDDGFGLGLAVGYARAYFSSQLHISM